ncbi:MAG TPA: adenylate/guanylate cyclase domain-containing protein [Thermoanaerobaculia bacterium]|nr:adenylate/guanylate cyclase domain-containing protein [Thermoanaerobaculia bacterium]
MNEGDLRGSPFLYSLCIKAPAGTVTLMFTDIVGSTALRDALVAAHGENDGDRLYRERFQYPHNSRIRAHLDRHHGFEVKTNGDSFMVAFGNAEDAVSCAVAIQRNLRDEPIETLAVRIGMHTGAATPYERDGKWDYDGHAVNIAARVESLLKGGERVYCSRATATLAKTPPGIRYHNYGPYLLKGVSEKIEIVDVLWDDAMQPAPPEQPHERLPYPWLTPWIGREREMSALKKALRASRLVTLHGIGGVGKTRLAVETLLARGGGLPREIVFVSLERAPDTPEGLLTAVRDALAMTEVDAPDSAALYRQLHGGDRLLLLDNFESVMSAAGSVAHLAATAGVRILVTSQRALDVPGERVIDLEPMETKTRDELATLDSYQLFVGLAQQRDAKWRPNDDQAMRDVLAATDGLPYLVELVAAVAPKRQLKQLANELKTLRARYPSAERHASVRACLEWALERLPAEGRTALPRLAMFAGGFDLEAAEAIAAITIASLDELVDASLLRFDRDTGRYSMLPTTREFARDRLDGNDQTRLAHAHAAWFIERLSQAGEALRAKGSEVQDLARRWIDADYENMRQAVAWAEGEEPKLFERAVFASGIYLRQTCRFSELVRLSETLLGRLSLEATPKEWAGMQNNLGIVHAALPTGDRGGNLVKAIECFHAALQVFTEGDFPSDWAMTQNNLGNAYVLLPIGDRNENLAKAIAYYESALRVRTEHDSPWARTQNNLGNAYLRLPTGNRNENLAKAIAYYEAALCVRTEHDFPADWATTQDNLGNVYSDLPTGDRDENLAKAIACYGAALRVRTEHDFPADWATTQNNLGNAYRLLSDGDRGVNLAKAIQFYEAALRVWTERDFPEYWADAQYNLGLAYEEMAHGKLGHSYEQAILCFEAATRGYSAVGLTDDAENARKRAAARTDDFQAK